MSNIDILEEKEKKAIENLKGGYWYVGEEGLEESIKIVLNLVESLIAENKKLKELLEEKTVRIGFENKDDYIPKSKVEEEIHYLKECKDFAKTGKFKEAQIQTELLEAVIKKLEQSLLGKE